MGRIELKKTIGWENRLNAYLDTHTSYCIHNCNCVTFAWDSLQALSEYDVYEHVGFSKDFNLHETFQFFRNIGEYEGIHKILTETFGLRFHTNHKEAKIGDLIWDRKNKGFGVVASDGPRFMHRNNLVRLPYNDMMTIYVVPNS